MEGYEMLLYPAAALVVLLIFYPAIVTVVAGIHILTDYIATERQIRAERKAILIRHVADQIRRTQIKSLAHSRANKGSKTTSRSGYVYLLRAESGLTKIGRTANPDDRMRTFAVKLPFQVEYEALIKSEDCYRLEEYLHNQYAAKRVNGEWFRLSDDDIAQIKCIDPDIGRKRND